MFHRNLNVLPVVLLLVGCGGGDFSAGGLEVGGDPGSTGGAAEADAVAAGATQGTGGVTGVTGGQSGVTGGSGSTVGDPGGAGGKGSGGHQAGAGGDPGGTGGTAAGGTGTGGAGTDAGPNGCSAPTTDQLTTALTAALPGKAAWAAFESSAVTPTCVAVAACGPFSGSTPTPNCGTISIQWGSVSALPSGDVYVSFTAQVSTPAKYGCSGAITNSCSISASATAGTLKVHADVTAPSPWPYWLWALKVESQTTWDATSTCPGPNFDPTAASGSLNRAIAAAVQSVRVTAPLSCP